MEENFINNDDIFYMKGVTPYPIYKKRHNILLFYYKDSIVYLFTDAYSDFILRNNTNLCISAVFWAWAAYNGYSYNTFEISYSYSYAYSSLSHCSLSEDINNIQMIIPADAGIKMSIYNHMDHKILFNKNLRNELMRFFI